MKNSVNNIQKQQGQRRQKQKEGKCCVLETPHGPLQPPGFLVVLPITGLRGYGLLIN